MARLPTVIADVLRAGDGKIVGKVRIQKILYLLEQLGLGARIQFSYHHYGPYAEQVAAALDFAELVDRSVIEEPGTTSSGYGYVAYKLRNIEGVPPSTVGEIPFDKAHSLVSRMQSETSVNIELAATIHWLKYKEHVANWEAELIRRKTSKATKDNIAKAMALLTDVGLEIERLS